MTREYRELCIPVDPSQIPIGCVYLRLQYPLSPTEWEIFQSILEAMTPAIVAEPLPDDPALVVESKLAAQAYIDNVIEITKSHGLGTCPDDVRLAAIKGATRLSESVLRSVVSGG